MKKAVYILPFLIMACGDAYSAPGKSRDTVVFDDVAPSQDVISVLEKVGLGKSDGVKYKAAIHDLNKDKESELIVRVESKNTCDSDMGKCRTVVVTYSKTVGWNISFDRVAKKVELGETGFAMMRNIIVDSFEAWKWNGTRYVYDLAATGEPIQLKEAPPNSRVALFSAFGSNVFAYAQNKIEEKIVVGGTRLTDNDSTQILARLDSKALCGMVFGCPLKVLTIKNGNYVPILDGFGSGKISRLPVARGGWRDLAVETPRGVVVYGWTGDHYAVAERVEMGEMK